MPATRWNATIDIKSWLDDDTSSEDEAYFLKELLLAPSLTDLIQKKGNGEEAPAESELPQLTDRIPPELPILPLRGLVVYPQTAVPLTIGQERSIRLVDDVVATTERLVGLVTSQNPELETPGPGDLFSIGTVAIVHRLFRAPDGTIRLLVQGVARFRLGEFTQTEPYLKALVHLSPETAETGLEVDALARNARSQFERIGEMIPSIPRELDRKSVV